MAQGAPKQRQQGGSHICCRDHNSQPKTGTSATGANEIMVSNEIAASCSWSTTCPPAVGLFRKERDHPFSGVCNFRELCRGGFCGPFAKHRQDRLVGRVRAESEMTGAADSRRIIRRPMGGRRSLCAFDDRRGPTLRSAEHAASSVMLDPPCGVALTAATDLIVIGNELVLSSCHSSRPGYEIVPPHTFITAKKDSQAEKGRDRFYKFLFISARCSILPRWWFGCLQRTQITRMSLKYTAPMPAPTLARHGNCMLVSSLERYKMPSL
jgi:hypothetical protein